MSSGFRPVLTATGLGGTAALRARAASSGGQPRAGHSGVPGTGLCPLDGTPGAWYVPPDPGTLRSVTTVWDGQGCDQDPNGSQRRERVRQPSGPAPSLKLPEFSLCLQGPISLPDPDKDLLIHSGSASSRVIPCLRSQA